MQCVRRHLWYAVLAGMQVVIGEGHTLEAHERVSLCKQRPSHANDSDDELEYAAKDGNDDGPCPPPEMAGSAEAVVSEQARHSHSRIIGTHRLRLG